MPKCAFNKVALQIALRHGCSPVNLLHIFRTPFLKNTSGRLLLILPNTQKVKAIRQWIEYNVKNVFPESSYIGKTIPRPFSKNQNWVFQQTFVLMNTSWTRLSSSPSEDVLIKTNIFSLLKRLQKTSWRRLEDQQMFAGLSLDQ